MDVGRVFFQISTFLSDHISPTICLVILGLLLATAVYLVRSGHVVVKQEQRPSAIVSTGAFGYVGHLLYLGSILVYLGLVISTASLISLALVVLIFKCYTYIAGYAERLLEERSDKASRRYRKTTGKRLPMIRNKQGLRIY